MGERRGGLAKCFYYGRKITTFLVSHIGLVSMVVGYCIIGAFTFEALERKYEVEKKIAMRLTREKVTDDLWNFTEKAPALKSENWTKLAVERLRKFEIDLVNAMRKDGWDGNEDPNEVQWSFAGALFYSIILITTIGYGHIAPKTAWGKVVTIFYAIVGIPLMLLCLSNIGDAMAQSFKFLYWKVCCYMCEKRPKRARARSRGKSFRHRDRSMRMGSGRGSFRRSIRQSQRSADSTMSDSGLPASISYTASDPEFSHNNAEREHHGINRNRPQSEMSGIKRDSKRSTHSDPTPAEGASGNNEGNEGEEPVYTNRYATDPEDRPSPKADRHKSGRSGRHHHQQVIREQPLSASALRQHPAHRNQHEMEDYPEEAMYADEYYYYDEPEEYYYDDEPDPTQRSVPIWLCVFLVVGYIFGGAFLFSGWEKWNFLDSAYFCFITLTTIGFGDFVPAQNVKVNAEVSITLCSLYLLFGIALLAMSFNLVQEEVISSVKSIAKSLGIIKDDDEEED